MQKIVASELGTEFCNRVMDGVFAIMGIKHIPTTPYQPQSNAQVERNHRTAKRIISTYIASNHKDWTDILPFATFAYNTAVHETLQMSPFFMLFLRELTISVDLTLPTYSVPPVAAEFHTQMKT